MDSIGATELSKSIQTLLVELKKEIRIGTKSLKEIEIHDVVDRINRLEIIYEQLFAISKSKDTFGQLLNQLSELEETRTKLTSQIENTSDCIWSVDTHFWIDTLNTNFVNAYKRAFGVQLRVGFSVLVSLPELLKSVWRERYRRALSGEQFSIIDTFEIENIPQYSETSFNPIKIGDEIVGVSCYSRDISDQKRYAIALKESEQRYKTLVNNIPSVTYRCEMDRDRTMHFISNEIEALSGFSANNFINNKVRAFNSIIYPADIELINKAVQIGVKNKKSFKIEYRIIHKNSTIKWVHERGRARFDVEGKLLWLDGVISDITSRKQSEEDLRESEEQYRAIFNSMSDVFIRADFHGNIMVVTPSIIEFLGFTPEEIIGKSIIELFKNPEDHKSLVTLLSEKGFIREYEVEILNRQGKEKVASINAKLLINEQGKPYGMEGTMRDITLRKTAQKALEERTQELNSIFENTPIILLLIDSKGTVLNINKAEANYSQYDKSQFLNQLADVAVKCVNTIGTNTSCGKEAACKNCVLRSTINQTLKTRENQCRVEGSLVIFKGNQEIERKFLISTTFIDFSGNGRILISIDDVTEMRQAEEEIRRLSAAVEQITASIIITDLKGRIEYVNPQFEKSTGYTSSEVMGKNPRVLKSDNTPADAYKVLWETILSGNTWQGEFLNVRKDKTEYWESAIISPITNRNGEATHFVAIKEDITERRHIQQELIRSEQELREVNEEKSSYLSILAHDLRGLVGSFHAYTDLILTHFDEFTETEFKEQLGNLTKVSGDSLNLLDNLLAWGKTTQGRITLKLTEINLFAETDIVIGMLCEIANSKKIRLINNISSDTKVTTDVNAYQTIIRNLINNAIKFSPFASSITISTKAKDSYIEVSVTDTGIGIDEKTSKKLFKLGENVVREGTNQEQGTGLGLIICKEMVKKLGGSINVESEPGKGSNFYFTLPF